MNCPKCGRQRDIGFFLGPSDGPGCCIPAYHPCECCKK